MQENAERRKEREAYSKIVRRAAADKWRAVFVSGEEYRARSQRDSSAGTQWGSVLTGKPGKNKSMPPDRAYPAVTSMRKN